jgi:ribonuclease III
LVSQDLQHLARSLGRPDLGADLLGQALTHRSLGDRNNERLEFLGDALLGFVIAQVLWERFPQADEHLLTRMRASLVREQTLATLARGLALGDYLRMGAGELRSGGHAKDSILADALEAVLAAVYLDLGMEAARAVVLRVFHEPLTGIRLDAVTKDPKTQLQELLQARHRPLPEYAITEIGGTQHRQVFRVSCHLPDDGTMVEGDGSSRRRAEQQAAAKLLHLLEDAPHA